MISFFFSFIFLLIFCFIVGMCMVAFRVYRMIHHAKKQFRDFQDMAGGGSHGSYRAGNAGYSQQNTAANNSTADNSYVNNEVLIDQRSQEERDRKIFSDQEGEYVDYVEEK